MRIVLSDKEWYYSRFVIVGGVIIISLCAGAFIYWNEGQKEEENTISQNIDTNRAVAPIPVLNPEVNKEEKEDDIPKEKSVGDSFQPKEPLIAVAIQGAVQKPGLYWLEADSRLQTLIDTAGGTSANAETRYLNLAAPLIDGTTVVIPEKQKIEFDGRNLKAKGPSHPSAYTLTTGGSYLPMPDSLKGEANSRNSSGENLLKGTTTNEISSANLIDINHATQQELETLPGIGPALARAIISYRENKPFESIDELTSVSGIGPKRFEKIRPFVTVTPP